MAILPVPSLADFRAVVPTAIFTKPSSIELRDCHPIATLSAEVGEVAVDRGPERATTLRASGPMAIFP